MIYNSKDTYLYKERDRETDSQGQRQIDRQIDRYYTKKRYINKNVKYN